MGINTEARTGTGIKFNLNTESDTLFDIVDHVTNDEAKKEIKRIYGEDREEREEFLTEILEIYLPKSIGMDVFGNSVIDSTNDPFSVMLINDDVAINKLISDLNLNKTIEFLAEVYIG